MNVIKYLGVYRTCSVVYDSIMHYLNLSKKVDNVERNKNNLVVNYHYGGKNYKIIVKHPKTRLRIIHIYDQDHNDVLYNVKMYLGPGLDCHSISLTPKDLGYKSLTFEILGRDTELFFDENDIIDLNNQAS